MVTLIGGIIIKISPKILNSDRNKPWCFRALFS